MEKKLEINTVTHRFVIHVIHFLTFDNVLKRYLHELKNNSSALLSNGVGRPWNSPVQSSTPVGQKILSKKTRLSDHEIILEPCDSS